MSNNIFVIAEIGINHEGDAGVCREMISAVSTTGADAVKLQTVDPESSYVTGTPSYDVFKRAELTREETADLFEYAQSLNVEVFTTVGDLNTLEWVRQLQPDAWKISSGLITNFPLIEEIVRQKEKLFISTGLATINEVDAVIELLQKENNNNFTLLNCTSLYPALMADLNLARIGYLKARYGCPVGFSDHSIGVAAAAVAVGAGATVIEKHFSLDVSRKKFDHAISLETDEFRMLVENARSAATMMGSDQDTMSNQIQIARREYLRTIVAIRPIKIMEIFTKENIGIKRPAIGQQGLEPACYSRLLGRTAGKSYVVNESIKERPE